VYTPNPIAAGFPTDDQPVVTDVSASITTHGESRGEKIDVPLPPAL
jgi:L-lactate dehydrogenase